LDFKHIYNLKKLLFLHILVRINNPVLKACYDMFSHQWNLLCCATVLIKRVTYVLKLR